VAAAVAAAAAAAAVVEAAQRGSTAEGRAGRLVVAAVAVLAEAVARRPLMVLMTRATRPMVARR